MIPYYKTKGTYPPDVFNSLWEHLVDLAYTERLFTPDEVLLELERGGDEIYQWAKKLSFMFIEPDEDIQKVVSEIVER